MMPSRTAEGEVESAPGRIALFKPCDDAQGVQIVVETEAILAQCGIESLFAGVAKGGMTDVVGKGESLGEFWVQAQGGGERAGDLGHFEGMGEAAAEVVAGQIAREAGEDLGFSGQTAKGAGVKNAGAVAGERQSDRDGAARDVCGQTRSPFPSTAMSGGSRSFRLGLRIHPDSVVGLVISQWSGRVHGESGCDGKSGGHRRQILQRTC